MSLSARERGMLVRALAAREHLGPDGRWVRVSRNTLDRWIRAYREGGFEALVPAPRRMANQTPERLLELACALRREQPARTAAQIHRIILETEGGSPSARTINRHLAAAGLPWKGGQIGRALGRFEAEFRNELWTGDALHGPLVDGRRTFLFCFLDDHSRLLCGYRWAAREDVLNASRALRAGIASRGLPKAVYVDNGSAVRVRPAVASVRGAGDPADPQPAGAAGGARQDRAGVPDRSASKWLVELEDRPPASLEELGQIFQAWVESGLSPASALGDRADAARAVPRCTDRRRCRASGRCAKRSAGQKRRTVSRTGTVGMHGNTYEVDPGLAGRRVDLIFDPLELAEVEVRLDGHHQGLAVPRQIKRHVHPRAQPPAKPAEPTGIDYLGLIRQRRERELQQRIDYRHLPSPGSNDDNDDDQDTKESIG